MAAPDEEWTPPDPFQSRTHRNPQGTPAFADMVLALRRLQDAAAGSNPPDDVLDAARAQIAAVAELLEPWPAASEEAAPSGRRPEDPGRGNPFFPPFLIDERSPDRVAGRVRFGRFHLGGNKAVHGGAIPLMFDEVLGALANAAGRPVARTASIHVDYRSITPLGPELAFTAWLDREEGRKRFLRGELRHGDTLCAEAQGLFIELRAGQP